MNVKIKALFLPKTFYMEKECIVENLIHFLLRSRTKKYDFCKIINF